MRALFDLRHHVINARSEDFQWTLEGSVEYSNKSNLYDKYYFEESDEEGMEEKQLNFDLYESSQKGRRLHTQF